MKEKSVSVVTAVLNRKPQIKKYLDAILTSNYKDYEVIVVDGYSTDGTKEILYEYSKKNRKLKVFIEKKPGRNAARNLGINKSRGEIIIFVDSDCIVSKNWMREIVKPFSDKEVGGVIGRTMADKKGIFWYHMENDYLQFIGHNSAYRKVIIKKLNGFDLRFRTAKEDTDLAWRVIENGYNVVFAKKAEMIHLSRRVSIFYRIKNQYTYIYDGLLRKKHKKLYRKYFYDRHVPLPAPLWPAILAPFLLAVFVYTVFNLKFLAIFIALTYNVIVSKKLYENKEGKINEKLSFLAFAWMLPLSRFFYFVWGYFKFRKV